MKNARRWLAMLLVVIMAVSMINYGGTTASATETTSAETEAVEAVQATEEPETEATEAETKPAAEVTEAETKQAAEVAEPETELAKEAAEPEKVTEVETESVTESVNEPVSEAVLETGSEDEMVTESAKETEDIAPLAADVPMVIAAVDNPVAEIGDNQYASLQEAIDAAQSGDTVKLVDGNTTVNGGVTITGLNITLDLNGRKLGPAKKTKDADGKEIPLDPIIKIVGGTVKVKNGTITGASTEQDTTGYSGGGIHAENANVTLENITLSGNTRRGNGGGGFYQSGGTLAIKDTTFGSSANNLSGTDIDGATAMYVTGCDSVSVDNVTFMKQGGAAGRSTVVYIGSCSNVTVQNSNFNESNGAASSSAEKKDTLLTLDKCQTATITATRFTDNKAGNAAIYLLNGTKGTLENSTLSGNTVSDAAIYVGTDCLFRINGTTITGTSNGTNAGAAPSGIYVANGGTVYMESGVLYNNQLYDVTIEKGAAATILEASAMQIADVDTSKFLWIGQEDTEGYVNGKLNYSPAEKTYCFSAGVLQSEEAEIIRNGKSIGKYKTFPAAVEAATDEDTVRLLPDEFSETSQPREIAVYQNVDLYKSLTIDLNGQKLVFSSSVRLAVRSENSLTVTGEGSMTGGYDVAAFGINRTIQVGANGGETGSLTVTDGAYVEAIVNYSTTTIKGTASVSKIGNYAGQVTLDNTLNTDLTVMLEFGTYPSKYESVAWLALGENFKQGEKAKIDIAITAYTGYVQFGPTHLKNWLGKSNVIDTLPLIKGSSSEKVSQLVNVVTVKDVPTAANGMTAVVTAMENDIVLFKNEGKVYVGGADGNDSNMGYSSTQPVATMGQAIELAKKGNGEIYVLDTIEVAGVETWTTGGADITIRRKDYEDAFAEVQTGGNLTLKDITLDGGSAEKEAVISSEALIEVSSGGSLTVEDGTVLQNNNHGYDDYYTCGGAINSKGGNITITGGTIQKCKAYNGGAVYAEGGTLRMSGGLMTSNSAKESGGAVMLANGARMYLSGTAKIDTNYADPNYTPEEEILDNYGGGIAVGGSNETSVNQKPVLYMTGGTISSNVASNSGGGIFIQSNAEAHISGGYIKWNSCSFGTFGGGGIYVNAARISDSGRRYPEGELYLTNAVIRNNTAEYMEGGGIAACPTSTVKIYLANGAAIYNNYGYMNVNSSKRKSDVYITNNYGGIHDPDVYISEYMLDGQPYLWKDVDGSDVATSQLHKITKLELYTEVKEYTGTTASVFIEGNHAHERGGGIGTNGAVYIGTAPTTSISVSANKVWNDAGAEQSRPDQIKVYLLRKLQGAADSTYERVAVEYLKPDANGVWGTVTFTDQPTEDANGNLYEYTVEEDMTGLSGYVGEVTKGTTGNTWTLTNTPIGSLRVIKSFAGDSLTGAQKAGITFTVTGPDNYSKTFTYEDMTNGEMLLENLTLGQYKVTESNAEIDGYVVDTTYDVGTAGTVAVEIGQESKVTVTNTYTRKGSLKITKTFTGREITTDQKAKVTFVVTGPDNYRKEFTYEEMTDGVMELTDLTAGEYTVEEINAELEDYIFTTIYNVADGKATVADGQQTEVTVTNNYIQEDLGDGVIRVNKSVLMEDISAVTDVDKIFYVALFSDPECTNRVSSVKELKVLARTSRAMVEFTGLALETYYVCETDEAGNALLTGDERLGFAPINPDVPFELTEENPEASANIINIVWDEGYYYGGQIVLTKTVVYEGEASAEDYSDEQRTFYFQLRDAEGNTVETAEELKLTFGANDAEQTLTIPDLTVNQGGDTVYILVEVDENGNEVAGSDMVFTVSDDGTQTVTLNPDNHYSDDAAFTNTFNGEDTQILDPNNGDEGDEEIDEPDDDSDDNEGDEAEEKTVKDGESAVKTGVTTHSGLFAGIIVLALFALAVVFTLRKRSTK